MAKMTIVPAVLRTSQERLRVAAYCRVSSNHEDQEHSYEAQVRYFTNMYKYSENEVLVGVYADEGISGTCLDKRTEFCRMLDDCRAGKIDRIVTKSVSRFARNTKDCLQCIRELKSLGISIAFEKENIDTARLSDEMMITVMGGLAQEESQSISNNIRWSLQKKMANGTYHHARVPYGYTKDKKGDLIIDPEKAEIVRRIFDMYISGMGIKVIAVTLNDEGIPSPTGIAWNNITINKMLRQEKYVGDTLWQKTYSVFMGEQFQPNRGQAPQYYIKDSHPAIISKEVFQLAQEMKKKSTHKSVRTYNSPFRKKLICGKCGHTYAYINSKRRVYWQCGYKHNIAEPCDNPDIYDDILHSALIAMCDKLHAHGAEIFGKCIAQLTELRRVQAFGTAEGMRLMKQIAELREQKLRLSKLLTKRFISEEKYAKQVFDLDRQIRTLSRNVDKTTDEKDSLCADIETLAELFTEYDGSPECRDEIMGTAVTEVLFSGDTITFRLLGGLIFQERVSDYAK